MNNEKVLINLLREKESYKEQANYLREALTDIHIKLISIGAPLNDNILAFNNKQLKFLSDIHKIIKQVI